MRVGQSTPRFGVIEKCGRPSADAGRLEASSTRSRKPEMYISVVVPVYNVPARLLRLCLDSLSQQSLRSHEYEIILVDDCSQRAETLSVLQGFLETQCNASLVRHAQNRGLCEARRSGVEAAEGTHILFVDGDDILARDALETLRLAAVQKQADIVTSPLLRWNIDNCTYAEVPITAKPFPADYAHRLRAAFSVEHSYTMCGRLFRRGLLDGAVLKLAFGQLHEDITTFVRVLFNAGVVAHVRSPLYYYTLNNSSITNRFTEKHVEGMLSAVEDWITCAREASLFHCLSPAIALGAERLVDICVRRCLSAPIADESKGKILELLNAKYAALPLSRGKPTFPGAKFLADFTDAARSPAPLATCIAQHFPNGVPGGTDSSAVLKHGLGPSDMAGQLRNKIVFIAQVDYHVRNALTVARALGEAGHACAILDNSAIVAGGQRQFVAQASDTFANVDYVRVEQCPYEPDWLATAKLVITYNDYNNEIRDALEYRNRLDLPSVCVVEGINDFLRVDFDEYRNLPYRRCEYVFLAGEHDEQYFADRKTHVVGLPIIEALSRKQPVFPARPLAVLNVNFTYGALEDRRDAFVDAARAAFEGMGLDWVITKHPMDRGDPAGLPVSSKTQYELIDECTVFVSRFATGILEALASGKPVIYFNPHGEKIEKFNEPMGAYRIANSSAELVLALEETLEEVGAGVDFRERALPFLRRHTAYAPDESGVADRFVAAVREIVCETNSRQRIVSQLLYDRLTRDKASAAAACTEFLRSEVSLLWEEIGHASRELSILTQTLKQYRASTEKDFEAHVETANGKLRAVEEALEAGEDKLRELERADTVQQEALIELKQSAAAYAVQVDTRVAVLGDAIEALTQETGVQRKEERLLREALGAQVARHADKLWELDHAAQSQQVAWAKLSGATSERVDEIEAKVAALGDVMAALTHKFEERQNEEHSRHQALNGRLAKHDRRLDALRADLNSRHTDLSNALYSLTEGVKNVHAALASVEARVAALEPLKAEANTVSRRLAALKAQGKATRSALAAKLKARSRRFEAALNALKADIARSEQAAVALVREELPVGLGLKLRSRLAAAERQIGELKYPNAPRTFVFFGHHKCASRFFRLEVFNTIAEATGARTRRYKIADPPFHYSRMDELDLCNMEFGGLGKNGRDVVWFANASERSLEKIRRATEDWKGLRVIRDPRQVLVSDYFHHKGDHPDVAEVGWVWDRLVKDKPILRALPEEEGLLYELDNITREVIETQILAPFDDPRIMTVKIEDFTRDPKKHLLRISEFLGVADIAGIDFNRTMANPDSGPWRRHFTSKLREVFKARYGQALIDLGYAEDLYW